MDSFEAHLDEIEAQRSTDDQRKRRYFPMNLINKGARTLCSRGFSKSRGDDVKPPTGDTQSVPKFLTNLRLSDLYNLPGEYVSMNPEIFSAMRAGNEAFVEKMKSNETPMECFKNEEGDSILHLAAAWGHLKLVKSIVNECPSLILELNRKEQLPLHVAARAGQSAVVKALVDLATYFSARLSEEDVEKLNMCVLKDVNGNTALHLALEDLREKTEFLMHKQRMELQLPMPRLIQFQRSISSSFSATSTCQMETAACLVKANQEASFLANKDGLSPLYMAVKSGNVSLVKLMLSRLVDNVEGKTFKLASKLEGRKSLVHAALTAENTDILDVILTEDPNLVNERDEEGRTCLSVGASVGFYKGICNLLDRSTSSVFECNDHDNGSFPIHIAIENGHTDIVEELLKRCPDSECLRNKQGQNILHIAAKSAKGRDFLLRYIKRNDRKNHLIEEQDVDGNTPLHIATINWRPRTVVNLIDYTATNTKLLNTQNKDGLKALDIAEINLQSDYIFRERMTLMVLICFYAPRGASWMPTSGMTLKSRSEHLGGNKYKDHISGLQLVAALVATVTFAAGFTLPGGFNSSAPNIGMAVLAKDRYLSMFLLCDNLAMFTSVLTIVALIWAQLGDPELAHKAFNLALPSLFIALVSMSFTFLYGVVATINKNTSLTLGISIGVYFFYSLLLLLLTPYVIPQAPGIPFLQRLTRSYLYILLLFVIEDDAEKHQTSYSSQTCVMKADIVESPSVNQVEKPKVS